MYNIELEGSEGADIMIKFPKRNVTALVDTGAYCCCMSEETYLLNGLPTVTQLLHVNVKTASGSDLGPLGIVHCEFQMGGNTFSHPFIVCKKLTKDVILGRDFLRSNKLHVGWSKQGKFQVKTEKTVLIQAITTETSPLVRMKRNVKIPGRTLVVTEMTTYVPPLVGSVLYDFNPTEKFDKQGILLVIVPITYCTNVSGNQTVLQVLINVGDEAIDIKEGTVMGSLIDIKLHSVGLTTPTAQESICEIDVTEIGDEFLLETLHNGKTNEGEFITSPAEIETHREIKLENAEVSDENLQQFQRLCKEYEDVFSKDSTDIGKTPLLTMNIDTGEHPPVCQRPYSLALRHVDWVREEIEKLEQAGVITRSMSPWASPIVIVPKKTSPGEPPRRRMCVDYRMVNSLAPPVVKAHSKAKGILTFVPLPKIDEIFAKLEGSQIYSTFDMRSGYYHLELDKESQAKTAFVLGGPIGGKWEFKVCPFGLTQAPAYFQRLIHQVLEGLPFAFGYLDDILVFSKSIEEHIMHVRQLFDRLRKASLKLTERKCNFLKKHVQYLGHLISGNGIEPVPEKLESLKEMPPPPNQKEVRRFLGFTGYYRKFIPRYSDIARPLTNLTKKDLDFEWTSECQQSFELLKEMLLREPILKYPDPDYGYILYTDASKYAWAGVLTQEYHYEDEGKIRKIHHPITYVSGLFRGPQINWAALTKEAYAIYMAARKLTVYIQDAKVLLRSDHLPLKKFLLRDTKNTKVNNWAVELQQFNLDFEYIEGIKNTLADTMSRLVKINPSIEKEPEKEDQEFGEYIFEKLDPILVNAVLAPTIVPPKSVKDEPIQDGNDLKWDVKADQLRVLQVKDKFCKNVIRRTMGTGKGKMEYPYYIKEGILHRYLVDNKQRFEVIVVPQSCSKTLLKLAHDDMGHNGSSRTYMILRRNYYWKGMKPHTYKYVKHCELCQKCNTQVVKYNQGHFEVPKSPMDFISMDLIGEFHPPTSQGFRYALTVICMLTGYTWCIPIKTKTAAEVVQAYLQNVYYPFGGSRKILSDNGTEFKNELFTKIADMIGVEHKIYSPPFHPQSNGRIEGFHNFLKACLRKHITKSKEWSEILPMACAGYNFFPNEHSRESPFFLMFGRDPRIPLTEMFTPKVRYMGNEDNILSLEALTEIYFIVAQNLKLARERMIKKNYTKPNTLTPNDMVRLRSHDAKSLEPRFKGEYRVVSIKGNQVQIIPKEGGPMKWVHIVDLKYILPVDAIISTIPPNDNAQRATKLTINPKNVPNLNWILATTLNTNFTTQTPSIRDTQPKLTTTTVSTVNTLISSVLPI